jgi:transposase
VSERPDAPPEPARPTRSRAAARQTWIERLERFARCGLSPAQFCAQEGVSLPSFYSWKRRLAADGGVSAPNSPADPPLLPVRLQPPNAPLELVLPTGVVLRIGPGCDLALVRSLVEILGGLPC